MASIDETRSKVATELRETVSTLLYEIHCAAMDASNEPTRESIRALQKQMDSLRKVLPDFYYSLGWYTTVATESESRVLDGNR
jgi:hypothetical protein